MGHQVGISATIGYLHTDHILYPKQQDPQKAFRFVSIVGWQLALVLVACVFLFPFIISASEWLRARRPKSDDNKLFQRRDTIAQERPKSYLEYFVYYLWHTAVVIIASDQIDLFRKNRSSLLLLWVMALFILEEIFVGDMISEMADPNRDIVIDSWDDLLVRDDIKSIAAFNTKTGYYTLDYAKSIYFPKGLYRSAFTPKLDVKSGDELFDIRRWGSIINNVTKGNQALMYHKAWLDYFSNNNPNLHVSRSGGRTEPYFIMFYLHAFEKMRKSTNDT